MATAYITNNASLILIGLTPFGGEANRLPFYGSAHYVLYINR